MSSFEAIGARLKESREALELTLQDVEKQTRIRHKYLQAIEFGQFAIIDNPTQLRGFLRKYARVVGIDDLILLAEYDAALRNLRKRPRRRKPRSNPPTATPPLAPNQPVRVERPPIDTSRYTSTGTPELYQQPQRRPLRTLIVFLVTLVLIGFVVGGIALTVSDLGGDETQPAGIIQAIDGPSASTPGPLLSPTVTSMMVPTVIGTPVLVPGEPLNVQLTATMRLWVWIEVDGVVQFQGTFRPNDGVSYQPQDYITIRTTNAGGLMVMVNAQRLVLGEPRQSVERTISVQNGILAAPGIINTPGFVTNPTQLSAAPEQQIEPTATNPPPDPTRRPTLTLTPAYTLPPGIASTSTSIPVFGFATDTPTATATAVLPSATPTFTASPFLPPRATRTPSPDKSN